MKAFFTAVLMAVSMMAQAQIEVANTGAVKLADDASFGSIPVISGSSINARKLVTVGGNGFGLNRINWAAFSSVADTIFSGVNVGVYGETKDNSSTTAKKVGVYGFAGYQKGYNYGVAGTVYHGAANAVGVYGTSGNNLLAVTGRYAGYFSGPVTVTGSLTVPEVLSPSDASLKENIQSLGNVTSERETLGKVLGMNVVQYNYKKTAEEEDDTDEVLTPAGKSGAEVEAEAEESIGSGLHYGVLAQELQTVYPNLVKEGQDGYLAVNYVELVPVLIQAIQEMQQEIDELRGGTGDVMMARQATGIGNATANAANRLYQNNPNPFKESTQIRFTLADDATEAAVCIFDMTGKQLKRIPVAPGMESVTLQGSELNAGMYLYSLIVNGQEVDTKRMILSK